MGTVQESIIGIPVPRYFTASNVTLYIGSFWLADAKSITWSYTVTRKPLYGYGDIKPRTWGLGKSLVYGSIRINYTERGYLLRRIQGVTSSKSGPQMAENINNRIKSVLKGLNIENKAQLIADSKKDKPDIIMALKQLAGWEKPASFIGTDPFPHTEAAYKQTIEDGLDLDVIFDSENGENNYRIKNVQFVSHNLDDSDINISVMSQGGKVICERYDFQATHIV